MIETLFPEEGLIGIFRGFTEGGLEFHADLALPYQNRFQNLPMHGQFVLVQLEHPDEAVLGRVTALRSEGRLTAPSGEDFNIRAMREHRQVSEQLREDYLKYRVDIRVLGIVRLENGGLTFVASHRRLPHVGSPVAFLADDVLREVAGHNQEGARIGYYALGEYIFTGGDRDHASEDWVQHSDPVVSVRFPVGALVSRRTFIFARAGFGKSNLNKLLFAELYRETPMVEKRAGRRVPVGTIIFDPDGEYFWPDDKGRPGLADVEHLKDHLVVFTSRAAPSDFYGSFVAGGIKLDIRTLSPSDVVSIALSPEKQDQQNVAKLRGMRGSDWAKLVDLIHTQKNAASLEEVRNLVGIDPGSEVEAVAARSNMTRIVNMLHDPSSQMMDVLLIALEAGKLCVVDVSQLRGGPAMVLSGLILQKIFDRNQDEFTKQHPRTIPTIAVIEEAQSVLNQKESAAQPYLEWVKEGRKYDLGALLVTQQPGSIPAEILSQGDNWFIFHLLSASDLKNVKNANAHFSDDLLSSLLNEPIPGHGVFWSSVSGKPYPVAFRALLFERLYSRLDKNYDMQAAETYASTLRRRIQAEAEEAREAVAALGVTVTDASNDGQEGEVLVDALAAHKARAVAHLHASEDFKKGFERGVPWGVVMGILKEKLPETMADRDDIAYQLVPEALSQFAGADGTGWHSERRQTSKGMMTFVVKGPKVSD
jgi:hypothetical protein